MKNVSYWMFCGHNSLKKILNITVVWACFSSFMSADLGGGSNYGKSETKDSTQNLASQKGQSGVNELATNATRQEMVAVANGLVFSDDKCNVIDTPFGKGTACRYNWGGDIGYVSFVISAQSEGNYQNALRDRADPIWGDNDNQCRTYGKCQGTSTLISLGMMKYLPSKNAFDFVYKSQNSVPVRHHSNNSYNQLENLLNERVGKLKSDGLASRMIINVAIHTKNDKFSEKSPVVGGNAPVGILSLVESGDSYKCYMLFTYAQYDDTFANCEIVSLSGSKFVNSSGYGFVVRY